MADEFIPVRGEVEIDGEAYRLLAFQAREALSQVPSAILDVTTQETENTLGPPEPSALVGKPVKITLQRAPDGEARSFAGIAVEVTRETDKDGRPFARLRVAPQLFRLGKRADCRTFQDKSVPDIVKEVLTDAGIPEASQDHKLSGSYDPRVYTVQYRESDLDFIARLLSEEGIYFSVRFSDGADKVVFGDDPKGLGPIEGESSLPFANTFGSVPGTPCVMWIRQVEEVRPDKVFLRDYDFERPKLSLDAEAEGKDEGPHALSVYAFPGRFVDQAVGKRYAQVLLDSMQSERDVVSGESTSLCLSPGHRFSITSHPYEPLNQEYLITEVETEAREGFSPFGTTGQAGRNYVCRFSAVPTAKTAYRPPLRARAEAMVGVQTAVTTGPSGGEIHTDKHGRVKIKYMWDRLAKDDDTSSLWVRTSQAPTGGSMLLPRVGWEVSVRHVEGDPDTPVVMTRLYNALSPPPYPLPANKARGAMQTATTPGGGSSNEFRMDDSKGKEEMMFNASKDMSVDVVNNTTESIGNNETISIGSNHKVNVTNSVVASVGADQTISVGGNQTVHVETFMVDQCGADHSLAIGGNRDMKIGGDHKREVGGASSTDVGSMQVDLVVGSVTDGTSADMKLDVGAAKAEITAGDRTFTVGGSRTEDTGAAKAVLSQGGRGVEVGGSMTQKVAGAILAKIGGDRADNAAASFTELCAGAHILKADSVVFEGDAIVSFVMGASTITLTPASISIAGVSIKIDGATTETAALVLDN